MNKNTGVIIAVVAGVAAILYLLFAQKKTTTTGAPVSTSLGLVPGGALSSLIPLPTPRSTPVTASMATTRAALAGAPLLCCSIPSLDANDLVTGTPAVCSLSAPEGVFYD